MLAAHRVPPQIMGLVPTNNAGFGSVESAALVFNRNEVVPLQEMFKGVNEWLGEEVIHFEPYELGLGGIEEPSAQTM